MSRGPRTVTPAEYRELVARERRGRRWIRTSEASERTVEGVTFRSSAEARRYSELLASQRGPWHPAQVRTLVLEPTFALAGVRYRPDFLWVDVQGVLHVEEVEGARTHPEKRRRRERNLRQMRQLHSLEVEVVTR